MTYALRNKIEHLRFQYVGTGINVLASRFVRLGLLEKTPDAPVIFSFHDAVGARVVDRCQDDGGDCLAIFVLAYNGLQIQVSEDIAVEDNGGLANQVLSELVGTGSAHRLRLDRVFQLDAKVGTIAELLFDFLRLIRKRERDVGDARATES